jgi:hypothetical protein
MARNDVLLVDSIIDAKMVSEGIGDRGEAFELFSFEQILKSYDLSHEELLVGWVDGSDDGGIDGFYTFVNGLLVQNPDTFQWPRKDAAIDIYLISCKHLDSFKQEAVNTLIPTIEELLDFRKSPQDFDGRYRLELLKARQIAIDAYNKTAIASPRINFYFAYACRGDTDAVSKNIEGRAKQIERIVKDYFSDASATFNFYGATELICEYRKKKTVLNLPYTEILSAQQGAFVVLANISAYARFVSDEQGNLRRYLFDSNVRNFLTGSRVNDDISTTLEEQSGPDFWWLNNGVTMLATNAQQLARTSDGNFLQLNDVQIVNGLQTTHSIYNHLKASHPTAEQRFVLIKVIVSSDVEVRDRIIQATNNQSVVELASLNATDKIQRDIEQILEKYDWYYERRRNYYKYIGKPPERFVTPLFLANAIVSLYRRSPGTGGKLKSKFMRISASYHGVFDERIPLEMWPVVAGILKHVDAILIKLLRDMQRRKRGRRSIDRNTVWRSAVALCAVGKVKGTFFLSDALLSSIKTSELTDDLIGDVYRDLTGMRDFESGAIILTAADKLKDMDLRCREFGERHGIQGSDSIGRWRIPKANVSEISQTQRVAFNQEDEEYTQLDPELLDKVQAALPDQPWPINTHKIVAQSLGIHLKVMRRCISELIRSGRRHDQIDGVVINADNFIVSVDSSRADPRYVVGEKFVRIKEVYCDD